MLISHAATIQSAATWILENKECLGNFTYSVPVQNGLWALTLRFSELEYQGPGKRVFDVYVNDVLMAAGYDVWARANSGRSMLNQGFSVNVTNGVMQIRFVSKVGLAAVSALELIPAALNSLPNLIMILPSMTILRLIIKLY